jgi:hypothetical protein
MAVPRRKLKNKTRVVAIVFNINVTAGTVSTSGHEIIHCRREHDWHLVICRVPRRTFESEDGEKFTIKGFVIVIPHLILFGL